MAVSLQSNLQSIGRKSELDGSIQCIDTIYGCLRTLYDLRLVQTTATLYDEFLFNKDLPGPMHDRRTAFLKQLQARPPRIVIVTPPLFPAGAPDYSKLAAWPSFHQFLVSCYTLEQDRFFPQDARVAPGYRLYRRLPQCSEQAIEIHP